MKAQQINIHQIGRSIKVLRVRSNLTQEDLADRIGYSVRNLRRIENHGTKSIETINCFAEFFNVSAFDILNGCLLFIKFPRNEYYQPSPYIIIQSIIRTCAP